MNKLTELQTFADQNIRFISALRDKLTALQASVNDLSDKTYRNRINEILQYLSEYEQYNKIAQYSSEERCSIDMYEIFRKFYNSFSSGVNKDVKCGLTFNINGGSINQKEEDVLSKSFTICNCLPIMQIIPTLLLDNALKYSVGRTGVTINFEQTDYGKKLSVENIGPKLNADELKSVFSIYRGLNASKTAIQGQGIGLNIANRIFMSQKWLNPDMEVLSSDSGVTHYNGIPYSKFVVSLYYDDDDVKSTSDKIIDISPTDCEQFVIHEFLRIYPKLCRSCIALYNRSTSKNKEIANNEDLREKCYEIKDLIIEFYIVLISYDEDFLNTDEHPYDQSFQFDKCLIKEVNYLCNTKGVSIETISNKKFYKCALYPPLIDVFIHILAKDLLYECLEDELIVNITQEYIELSKSENFKMNNERIDVLNHIISSYDMELVVKGNIIEISKL